MTKNSNQRPIDYPDIIEIAKYIYKHPKNTTKLKYYTDQIDANYEFNSKPLKNRIFDKRKYAYNIQSNNIDSYTKNKVNEEQHLDRRKHMLGSQKRDNQSKHVIVSETSKKPALDLNSDAFQKPNNTDIKKFKKISKYESSERNTTKHLKPDLDFHNVTKYENSVLSKNKETIGKLKIKDFPYMAQRRTQKHGESHEKEKYVYHKPELTRLFNLIPRIGADFTEIENTFALHSFDYVFVSSFLNKKILIHVCTYDRKNIYS